MREKLIKFIATVGGLGYSRIAPGTTGSLAGAAIYLLINKNLISYIIGILLVLILGFAVCGRAEVIFGKKDAKPIAIDEVAGLLISLFLIPFSYANLIIGFLLFRTIDIIKPFPIKKIERLPGSLGVMTDDIVAGIYANLLLRLALKFFLPH